jgi:hypothetical protein
MIVVAGERIGMDGKTEKIFPVSGIRRLTFEWTTQLPATRHAADTR